MEYFFQLVTNENITNKKKAENGVAFFFAIYSKKKETEIQTHSGTKKKGVVLSSANNSYSFGLFPVL